MGISFETGGSNVDDEQATMQYYDANGKKVKEGSPEAVVQHLSNDPNRPDAKAKTSAAETNKAITSPTEDKAVKSSAENK